MPPCVAGREGVPRGRPDSPAPLDFWSELWLGTDQRVDVPESLVAVLKQLLGRLGEQRPEVAVKSLIERCGGGLVIQAGAAFGLSDDLFDDAHRQQVTRGQLKLFRRLHLA